MNKIFAFTCAYSILSIIPGLWAYISHTIWEKVNPPNTWWYTTLCFFFFPWSTIRGIIGKQQKTVDHLPFVTFFTGYESSRVTYLILTMLFWPLKVVIHTLALITAMFYRVNVSFR